jgi:hypothetical protein
VDGVCARSSTSWIRGLGSALALLVLGHVHGALRDLIWMAVMLQGTATLLCLVPLTLTTRNGRREHNDGKIALEALRAS